MSRVSTFSVAAAAGLVTVLLGIVILAGGQAAATRTTVGVPTRLDTEDVPAWAVPLLQRAAGECDLITAPLLAAQIDAESGWDATAVSSAGAEGLAQFMPGAWVTWGRDGDGDGARDPFSPPDAIAAQGAYMCHLADQVTQLNPNGETLDLALASYNAGIGAIQRHGGIPPYPETTAYVTRIRRLVATYAAGGQPIASAEAGVQQVTAAGKKWIGTPYAWGGGTVNGPSEGFAQGEGTVGFDCSSLVMYAYYQGTGGDVKLPRTSAAQYADTSHHTVPLSQLQPGDLLFWGESPETIHHVALYIGNGTMLNAPRTGAEVQIEPVSDGGSDLFAATRVL